VDISCFGDDLQLLNTTSSGGGRCADREISCDTVVGSDVPRITVLA
jgi:hypothetical protein